MVTNRSYHQFCPIAYSLDVVGDRWTLLILRELLYGPRRYSDLQRGLPGIASNLLARRLKELDEAGLIQQRKLPPPAAVTVYDLTDYGQSVRPIADSLTAWGLQFIGNPQAGEDFMGVVPAMNALDVLFSQSKGAPLVVEVSSGGEVFYLSFREGGMAINQGIADFADLRIEVEPRALVTVAAGVMPLDHALSKKLISVEAGDTQTLGRMLSFFRLPLAV